MEVSLLFFNTVLIQSTPGCSQSPGFVSIVSSFMHFIGCQFSVSIHILPSLPHSPLQAVLSTLVNALQLQCVQSPSFTFILSFNPRAAFQDLSPHGSCSPILVHLHQFLNIIHKLMYSTSPFVSKISSTRCILLLALFQRSGFLFSPTFLINPLPHCHSV